MNPIAKLPKLELHAHLNGSLSEATLRELSQLKGVIDGQLPSLTQFHDLSSCFEIFQISHNLTKTMAAVMLATKRTISEFAEDGVIYLELRSTPRREEHMTKHQYLFSIIEAIKSQTLIPVTLLVSINRGDGVAEAIENIQAAVDLYKTDPDVVVGVDFSGNPLKGKFSDYIPALKVARESGLKISLHCGEIENDHEVEEMLNFMPDRLGHVTCLSPEHLNRLKALRLPIELCLTSNVLCETVPDYESHHFKFYDADYPFILGTDDKGVFQTTLTKEYDIAMKTYNMSVTELLKMNLRAVEFIFSTSAATRKQLLNKLQTALNA